MWFCKVAKYVKVLHFDICMNFFLKEGGGNEKKTTNIYSLGYQ